MEPDTNLYSPNENNEIIRENSQKKLYVLAAHQIALWEYDIPTGKCSFTDDYFRTLGLKDSVRQLLPDTAESYPRHQHIRYKEILVKDENKFGVQSILDTGSLCRRTW